MERIATNLITQAVVNYATNRISEEFKNRNGSNNNNSNVTYKYKCHECNKDFEATEVKSKCPHCSGEFIEILEESKQEPGNSNNRSSGSNQLSLSDLMRFASVAGTAISTSGRYIRQIEQNHGPQIRTIVGQLATLTNQVVQRSTTDSNGERRNVTTNLGDLIAPLISSFGLLNNNTASQPVSERQLDELEEINITKEHNVMNEETKEEEPPKCSICIYEIYGLGVKTECNHFFHKDCLKGWLRIHNQCPVCRDQVVR